MKNKIKTLRQAQGKTGFTLIELLVVIAIIGILTIISVSSFANAQVKAKDSQRKSDLNNVSKALMMYYNDNGVFPNINSRVLFGNEDGFNGDNNIIYMRKTPQDPKYPSYEYIYKVSADFKEFNLFANLENKQDSQCEGNDYSVDEESYCYGVSSPNTIIKNWP